MKGARNDAKELTVLSDTPLSCTTFITPPKILVENIKQQEEVF